MPTKDSESLKFIKYGEQVAHGLADGLHDLPCIYEVEEELEEEPTPWPKENPYIKAAEEVTLTGAISPETATAFVELFVKPMAKVLAQMVQAIADVLRKYPNRRVVHLALHGRPRTRKKNTKRIARYFKKIRKD